MKKQILTLTAASVLAAASANAQGIVAGWDLAGVTNIFNPVDGYAAEKTSFNNGVATSGSISVGQGAFFAANGAAASQPGFGDGFSTTTSDLFGGGETGQQSINFNADSNGEFEITFNFTSAYDVVVNMDWLTSTTGFADIIDVSFSTDGGNSFNPYLTGGTPYTAVANNAVWSQSTGNAGGAIGFLSGFAQTDQVIDLTALTPDAASAINAIRFEFSGLAAGERIGLDNIHVAGTAVVPEPSTYAAIAGALALGFVAYRRRK